MELYDEAPKTKLEKHSFMGAFFLPKNLKSA
jgi:hypothetical protein